MKGFHKSRILQAYIYKTQQQGIGFNQKSKKPKGCIAVSENLTIAFGEIVGFGLRPIEDRLYGRSQDDSRIQPLLVCRPLLVASRGLADERHLSDL